MYVYPSSCSIGGKVNGDRGSGYSSNRDAWSMDKLSVPFYFTNFPNVVDSKKLWDICDRYGVVSDVYMDLKLSKLGKRFAFVRFIKVDNERDLESKL